MNRIAYTRKMWVYVCMWGMRVRVRVCACTRVLVCVCMHCMVGNIQPVWFMEPETATKLVGSTHRLHVDQHSRHPCKAISCKHVIFEYVAGATHVLLC